jgi:hypothetical protein
MRALILFRFVRRRVIVGRRTTTAAIPGKPQPPRPSATTQQTKIHNHSKTITETSSVERAELLAGRVDRSAYHIPDTRASPDLR